MKKRKALTWIFGGLAVLLSNVMCAVVAANYTAQAWGAKYECWSAPPEVAYFYAIPFVIGILICGGLAWFFYRN